MTVNILPHCHALVRIRLLQQILPLSQDLHAIGCKLDNEHLKGIAIISQVALRCTCIIYYNKQSAYTCGGMYMHLKSLPVHQ